jgi:hypothetical protein
MPIPTRRFYSKPAINIYMRDDSYLYCIACSLNPHNKYELVYGYKAFNTGAMVMHVRNHELAGDTVPKKLIDILLKDDYNNFHDGGTGGSGYTAPIKIIIPDKADN